MKTLVLCPRAEELEVVSAEFKKSGLKSVPGTTLFYPSEEFLESSLILAVGGQGKVNFAIHAMHALERYPQVQNLICVGAGGALDSAIGIKSVVLATFVFEHDFKSHFRNHNGVSHKIDNSLFESVKNSMDPSQFLLHMGGIASGDEDILDPQLKVELSAQTQCLAVAWEGAGGARAARFYKKKFFEIRGITDSAESFDSASYQKILPEALAHAAHVTKTLIGLLK